MTDATGNDSKLELAKRLVEQLQIGEEREADHILSQLSGFSDASLFNEVGRLTRDLHESIKHFVVDSQFQEMAQQDMPDAAERLRYVITMTKQAADTTLGVVEDALPLTTQLQEDARRLAEQWSRFNSRELSVEDFRRLSEDLQQFLGATEGNAKVLHDKLSEVLMAQGFQDLTGQIIGKVIHLVQDVEHKLVELVRLSGSKSMDRERLQEQRAQEAMGPVVPNVEHGEVVTSQDDVDDLLSSLGF